MVGTKSHIIEFECVLLGTAMPCLLYNTILDKAILSNEHILFLISVLHIHRNNIY